jgi:hypothetical protein
MITLTVLLAVYLIGCAVAFMRLAWLCGGPVDAFFTAMFAGGVFDWPIVLAYRLMGHRFGGY